MRIPPWLESYVNRRIAPLLRWSTLATSSADGRCEWKGRERAADDPNYQHPVRLLQHYGFRSRPGPGTEAIGLAIGGSFQRAVVATKAPGIGPEDQAEWEVELYAKFGQRIILAQSGRLALLTSQGNKVELLESGALVLTSKGGATLTMDAAGKVSEHDELLRSTHFGGRGGTPTIALPAGGGALGNAGQIIALLTEGTDTAFRFTAQVDPMTPGGPGDIAEVTFAKKFTRAPRGVSIQAANDAAALVLAAGASTGGGSYYFSATDSKLTIKTTATLVPATTLVFSVTVVE